MVYSNFGFLLVEPVYPSASLLPASKDHLGSKQLFWVEMWCSIFPSAKRRSLLLAHSVTLCNELTEQASVTFVLSDLALVHSGAVRSLIPVWNAKP